MQLVPSSVRKMFTGTATQRISAALTFVMWFAMGAYIVLAIDHHFAIVQLSDSMAAVCGGAVATCTAIAVKYLSL